MTLYKNLTELLISAYTGLYGMLLTSASKGFVCTYHVSNIRDPEDEDELIHEVDDTSVIIFENDWPPVVRYDKVH